MGLGRVQAQPVETRCADRTVLLVGTLAYASEVGTDFADRAVDFVHTDSTRGSGLLFAGIPAADKAATVGDRTVRDAKVPGVIIAAEEAEESNGDKSEAFHEGLDASAWAVFTPGRLERPRFASDNRGSRMSGHSKWSTIKRKKGAVDAARAKLFTKIIKEITVAARVGGGDPDGNPRLRRAVDAARTANMPADNVTRAIKKGTGELEGVQYEELVYDGIGPDGALFVCEVVTDNRNRTIAEVRKIFDKNHGQIGSGGSAAWAFEQKGVIRLDKGAASEETLFEMAVGAGAENLELVGDQWVVTTARNDLDAVSKAISDGGVNVEAAALEYIPNNPKTVEGSEAEKLMQLFEALDEHDDVQNVFADFELSEQALAELG